MRTIVPKDAHFIPVQAERVFKGIIYDVYQWQQDMYDGSKRTFEMLRRPDTVVIIGVKDGKVVVIDEEQPHHGREIGLPSGRNDEGDEDELTCAKREMLEETGMTFKTWRLLAVRQPVAKIEWFVYIFLATDFISQTAPHLDGGEKITLLSMTIPEVIEKTDLNKETKDLLQQAGTIDGLLTMPEYK